MLDDVNIADKVFSSKTSLKVTWSCLVIYFRSKARYFRQKACKIYYCFTYSNIKLFYSLFHKTVTIYRLQII